MSNRKGLKKLIRPVGVFFRVKVKCNLEQSMKAQRGSRVIAVLFL